ncbi:hypothetical protein D9M68_708210 [compost metagenome]
MCRGRQVRAAIKQVCRQACLRGCGHGGQLQLRHTIPDFPGRVAAQHQLQGLRGLASGQFGLPERIHLRAQRILRFHRFSVRCRTNGNPPLADLYQLLLHGHGLSLPVLQLCGPDQCEPCLGSSCCDGALRPEVFVHGSGVLGFCGTRLCADAAPEIDLPARTNREELGFRMPGPALHARAR